MNIFFFLSAMGHALNWRHTENKFMGLPWNSEIYIKNKQGFVTFSSVGFVQDSKLTFWGLKTYDNRLVVSNIALVPTLLSCVCVCVCASHGAPLFIQLQHRPLIAILLPFGSGSRATLAGSPRIDLKICFISTLRESPRPSFLSAREMGDLYLSIKTFGKCFLNL